MSEKIQKVLANAGLGSRRKIEDMIREGRVSVNREVAKLGDRINLDATVFVDGREIKLIKSASQKTRVLIYHKPEGEMCTRSDPDGRPTVFDRLPLLRNGRWISIGRLDFNTSGILLLTNDGELANQLMHPSAEVEREYAVRIRGPVPPATLTKLRRGVELNDGEAKFETITDAGGEGTNHWYHVIVREGRNRLVRRLWESQGFEVSRLIRIRYGSVTLPRLLPKGRWEEMEKVDIHKLSDIGIEETMTKQSRGRQPQATTGRRSRNAKAVQRADYRARNEAGPTKDRKRPTTEAGERGGRSSYGKDRKRPSGESRDRSSRPTYAKSFGEDRKRTSTDSRDKSYSRDRKRPEGETRDRGDRPSYSKSYSQDRRRPEGESRGRGAKPSYGKSYGQDRKRPEGDRDRSARPSYSKPYGKRPDGETRDRDSRSSYSKPYGKDRKRPEGDRDRSSRPSYSKPYGKRSDGETRDRGDRPTYAKSFGQDRKRSSGESRGRGSRPSYGKPYSQDRERPEGESRGRDRDSRASFVKSLDKDRKRPSSESRKRNANAARSNPRNAKPTRRTRG